MTNHKYLLNGEEVEAIQQLEDGHWLIYRIYEVYDEYGDPDYILADNPTIVDKVFDAPPKKKFADALAKGRKELEEIQQSIEAFRQQKMALHQELHEAQIQHEKRMEKYRRYDALKHLDRFLNNAITHYVVIKYTRVGKIVGIDEYLDGYAHTKRRLLMLCGDTDGNLDWRLSYYSDGSGSSEHVYPFCSYQEAHDFVQSQYDELDVGEASMALVESADKGSFSLPAGYRESAVRKAREVAAKRVVEKEAELQKAKDMLEKYN